jgi:hypothetical protein
MRKTITGAVAAGLTAMAAVAQAEAAFQGRLADGTPSSTCTVSGSAKCASFYDASLDITILNDWNIGQGIWSATAAAGSAQALAEAAGFAVTGLTGWVLPTADVDQPAGALNQVLSIWLSAGAMSTALPGQFDGVQTSGFYFSSSVSRPLFGAWAFNSNGGFTDSSVDVPRFAVAVRPGDVAAVPEPQTWLMLLTGFGSVALACGRRRDRGFGTSDAPAVSQV